MKKKKKVRLKRYYSRKQRFTVTRNCESREVIETVSASWIQSIKVNRVNDRKIPPLLIGLFSQSDYRVKQDFNFSLVFPWIVLDVNFLNRANQISKYRYDNLHLIFSNRRQTYYIAFNLKCNDISRRTIYNGFAWLKISEESFCFCQIRIKIKN